MKKKNWLACIAVWLAMVCGCACAEDAPGILYRVEGGKSELFLLGSIHVGSEDMYPLGSHILKALDQAETLVFECDTDSSGALQEMMELMYYPAGESVENYLSPECQELLKRTAEKTGYAYSVLRTFKPWAAVSLLTVETTAAEMGTAKADRALQLGVEAHVKALQGEKTTRYLETARQQLEIMDGFSLPLQEYMLRSACETILDPDLVISSTLSSWPEWWRKGETDRFAAAYLEEMAEEPEQEMIKEYHDALVTRRNRSMAGRIAMMLEEEGSFFVTVGLMHLVLPDDSILGELEKMGYQIQRVYP